MKAIELLERIRDAFRKNKASHLRKIYSEALNRFLVERNKELLEISLISYVLSKIVSKNRFRKEEYTQLFKEIEEQLSIKDLKEALKMLRKTITKMDRRDQRYVFDLFTKGKIKIAATLYAKGLSLGNVSKLFNIPKEEILSYAGKTMMFDRIREELEMKDRIKILRRMIE